MAERASRRQRQREATLAEIRGTARQLLVQSGQEAMSISAVARRMGLSGPAIYRYYSSHDALVGAVVAELFGELTAAIERARDEQDGPDRRLPAMATAMRAWAVGHRAEFRLLFAAPIPEANRHPESERSRAGEAFDQVFLDEVESLWHTRPFQVPGRLSDGLREQASAYAERKGTSLPPEAVQVFLTCWTRLYGLLVMEALDQLAFAYTDTEPIFEATLSEVEALLGIGRDPAAD